MKVTKFWSQYFPYFSSIPLIFRCSIPHWSIQFISGLKSPSVFFCIASVYLYPCYDTTFVSLSAVCWSLVKLIEKLSSKADYKMVYILRSTLSLVQMIHFLISLNNHPWNLKQSRIFRFCQIVNFMHFLYNSFVNVYFQNQQYSYVKIMWIKKFDEITVYDTICS